MPLSTWSTPYMISRILNWAPLSAYVASCKIGHAHFWRPYNPSLAVLCKTSWRFFFLTCWAGKGTNFVVEDVHASARCGWGGTRSGDRLGRGTRACIGKKFLSWFAEILIWRFCLLFPLSRQWRPRGNGKFSATIKAKRPTNENGCLLVLVVTLVHLVLLTEQVMRYLLATAGPLHSWLLLTKVE